MNMIRCPEITTTATNRIPSSTPAHCNVTVKSCQQLFHQRHNQLLSISFYHGFLIVLTLTMIVEKRLLTLWVRCDGLLQGRFRVSIFAGAASASFFVVTVTLNQFVDSSDNAVQALPHVGPHPILKIALGSLQTLLLDGHINHLEKQPEVQSVIRVLRSYNSFTTWVRFQKIQFPPDKVKVKFC